VVEDKASSVPQGPRAPETGPGSLRLRAFTRDESTEWLMPKDLALAAAILSRFPVGRRVAIEIGVWRGGWSIGVLENVDTSSVIGVDPYPSPSSEMARAALLDRLDRTGTAARFHLVPSRTEAEAFVRRGEAALVHVDGLHTETGAGADLEWAGRMIGEDGIIVVDDYLHAWFPGISSAMHAFLREQDYRMVLATENKAYLCRRIAHARWYRELTQMLEGNPDIEWARHADEAWPVGYLEVPDVLGASILMALGRADVLPRGVAPGTSPRSLCVRSLRSVSRELLPPILHRAIRGLFRSLRPGR